MVGDGPDRGPSWRAITTVPGMPPVVDPTNLYSETAAGKLSPAVAGRAAARLRAEPARRNDVYVIDPATLQGRRHASRSASTRSTSCRRGTCTTLWVANNAEGTHRRQPDADRSRRPASPGTAIAGRRPVQHVLHARRQVGDRRRRGAASGSTSATRRRWRCSRRSTTPRLRRHQPRRLLDRRPVRDLHLRVPAAAS